LGWRGAALLTTNGIVGLLVLTSALNHDFPPNLLQEFADLPWPLR